LTPAAPPFTLNQMVARYSAYVGRRVEVQYRAGDIILPASGTLAADSGRSIFLEEHFDLRGQRKYFRWEIPYQYIVRIEEKPAEPLSKPTASPAAPSATKATKAAAADSSILQLRNHTKEA
jgi:hypothetical protein